MGSSYGVSRRRAPKWLRRVTLPGRGPYAHDALLAVVLVGIGWFGIVMRLVQGPYTGSRGWVLAGVSATVWAAEHGPVALRHRAPLIGLAGTVAARLAGTVFAGVIGRENPVPPVALALAILVYSARTQLDRRWTGPAVALAAAVLLAGTLGIRAVAGLPLALVDQLFGLVLAVLIPALLGEVVRTRRAYTAALEDRARRLEQERHERDRQAAREERLRISRELHDVVTHHLTGMVVEAGAGERRAATDPDAAVTALGSLRLQGRAALDSLRDLVGVLRDASDPTLTTGPPESAAPLAPAPSAAWLDELVDAARARGTEVAVIVRGCSRELPDAVDLASYRIVQESLTNVGKHAVRPCAEVTIIYGDAVLDLCVRNPGPALASTAPGYGLIGMRERVDHLAGSLNIGRGDDGWWTVHAVLPTVRRGGP